MKLITEAKELEKEFKNLIENYDEFYWATAWASSSSILFDELLVNRNKIKKMVVGIHFYQTHPNFIKAFLDDKNVRFIEQPQGTFHPKLYLFKNSEDDWTLIVGSANFTGQAFSKNTEASLMVTQGDTNAGKILSDAQKLVDNTFSEGKVYNNVDYDKYYRTWKRHRPKLNSLSGQYASEQKVPKPVHNVSIMNKSWDEYMAQVNEDTIHGVKDRIQVIELAHDLFRKVNHFNELNDEERKFIGGVENKLNRPGSENSGYFGSMMGAGIFRNKINGNNNNISKALDQIPLTGQLTKSHYMGYIEYFVRAMEKDSNYIATATRLIAMKRPDVFICLDTKNRNALGSDFGISVDGMDYERYWDDIIARIYDSEWWQNPQPKNDEERKVSEARAAFLDSIYFGG